ncbi:MAG: type I pantothenate kinase, partial [Lactobacillus amylovorus]|nr:type I pantothenate kinase [Lactobacillus amylovorus]
MENRLNYYKIERDEWSNFYQEHIVPLTEEELLNLKSLNDQISLKD